MESRRGTGRLFLLWRIDHQQMNPLIRIFSRFLPAGRLYGIVEARQHPLKADILTIILAGILFWLLLIS